MAGPGSQGGATTGTSSTTPGDKGGNVYDQSAANLAGAGQATGMAGANFASTPQIRALMPGYQNPYENQVVGNVMSDIDRARQIALTQNAAAADAAGAFAGSRHGLVEGQTNEAALRQMARTASELRHQGFQTAGALAGQDVNNRLAAGQGLAALAPNLVDQAQTGFNMGQAISGQQAGQGELVRGVTEAIFGQGAGMFDRYTGQPTDLLRLRLGALGANPLNAATTTTQTAPAPPKGGGAGSALGGLLGLFLK
jgi:hypothetical protein